tara:strand:- start:1494 stop:2069 length:576 start_codon:yes stop_codon:yes gene_type:complete
MARKIKASTDNSGWVEPKKKIRKRRKPMTEEQKQAAAARLEKAREARAAKNPDYGQSGIHESLRDLPEDHRAHPKKVKKWIKTQKELAASERRAVKQGVKGAYSRQCTHEGYVRNLVKYLRDGDYVDDFYGEYMEHKTGRRCIAMAYYPDGTPKRNVGVWYPDIGKYTKEMYNEDNNIIELPKKKKRKSKK